MFIMFAVVVCNGMVSHLCESFGVYTVVCLEKSCCEIYRFSYGISLSLIWRVCLHFI